MCKTFEQFENNDTKTSINQNRVNRFQTFLNSLKKKYVSKFLLEF